MVKGVCLHKTDDQHYYLVRLGKVGIGDICVYDKVK